MISETLIGIGWSIFAVAVIMTIAWLGKINSEDEDDETR